MGIFKVDIGSKKPLKMFSISNQFSKFIICKLWCVLKSCLLPLLPSSPLQPTHSNTNLCTSVALPIKQGSCYHHRVEVRNNNLILGNFLEQSWTYCRYYTMCQISGEQEHSIVYRNRKRSEMYMAETPRCSLISSTPLKKDVSSGWEWETPGCEDISQAPIGNWEGWGMEHTLPVFSKDTLCSRRWRGGLSKQTTIITLDFSEHGNEFSYMFSQFHTFLRDTTMPTTEAQQIKNSPFLYRILYFRRYVCINCFSGLSPHLWEVNERDSFVPFYRLKKLKIKSQVRGQSAISYSKVLILGHSIS